MEAGRGALSWPSAQSGQSPKYPARDPQGQRRFAFLVEESVLHNGLGDADTQAEQLDHLLTVGALPDVSVGVIPTRPIRARMPVEDAVHSGLQSGIRGGSFQDPVPAECSWYEN
ncbi:Scr1 family TA system antitoxin-like transcriptional regulator [Streptomyces sp. NBC_01180]|uniref:Scr1 family TA system antitoxin-like transcriptional regulator n=1 Tax=Streptomyces sp. NBC_01180 TaxID=2903763 RepID=UPI00386EC11E